MRDETQDKQTNSWSGNRNCLLPWKQLVVSLNLFTISLPFFFRCKRSGNLTDLQKDGEIQNWKPEVASNLSGFKTQTDVRLSLVSKPLRLSVTLKTTFILSLVIFRCSTAGRKKVGR